MDVSQERDDVRKRLQAAIEAAHGKQPEEMQLPYSMYDYMSDYVPPKDGGRCTCGAKYDREFPNHHLSYCDQYRGPK